MTSVKSNMGEMLRFRKVTSECIKTGKLSITLLTSHRQFFFFVFFVNKLWIKLEWLQSKKPFLNGFVFKKKQDEGIFDPPGAN